MRRDHEDAPAQGRLILWNVTVILGNTAIMASLQIASEVIELIKERLTSLGKRKWDIQNLELQDDGHTLLVSVEVPLSTSPEVVRGYCKTIRSVIEPLVPPAKERYSWVVGIKMGGQVVDSEFPEVL